MSEPFTPVIEDTPEQYENEKDSPVSRNWFTGAMKKLKPGKSFFVPNGVMSSHGYLSSRTYTIAKRLGFKMSIMKERKDGIDGYRVIRRE